MLVVISSGRRTFRLDAKASQMMNISIITAVSEIREPIDDSVFHRVYASG